VVNGLARTARVITAAALIMITVFGAFVLNPNAIVKMMGFGMAVAVLVDATVVRMLLELASESWVTRARLAALEAKIGSVEDLELSPEAEAALATERDAFVKRIFSVLER
jgi:hypothetical protein